MRSTLVVAAIVTATTAACGPQTKPAPTAPPPVAVAPPPVAPAPPPPPPTPPKLRLPDDVVPLEESLYLSIRPDGGVVAGHVDIKIDFKHPTTVFWLHTADIHVGLAELDHQRIHIVPKTEGDFQGFTLDQPITGTAVLHLEYSGEISTKESQGVFKQKEDDLWYVFTQFEATDARRAFPCFDEPSFKIPWQLTLEVPKDTIAVSNTPMLKEVDTNNGMKAVTFARTRPLPSYLVAFGIGPFDIVEAGHSKGGAPIRIIAPRGHAAQAKYAAESTAEILGLLEDYFGMPYPFEKLDELFIPQTVGFSAMENPGLITYAESILLAKPEEDTLGRQRHFAIDAAHELAHQWFGDLVTLAWWNDIWLNESFASWMENKIIHQWKPKWGGDALRVRSHERSMSADSLATARAIRQPIGSDNDIANAFDGITYGKGEAVLEMFESYLGEERFQKGVRAYIAAHAEKNATAADFLAAMNDAAGEDIESAFRTFLDQPGTPQVSVELVCSAGAEPKVMLTQKRFMPIGSSAMADEHWKIPVCVEYANGKKPSTACTLLTTPDAELVLHGAKKCPDWIFPNANETGYYRMLLKGNLLARLMDQSATKLKLAERLGLVGDIHALVLGGLLPAADALELVAPLVADGNRHTMEAAIGLVRGVRGHLVADDMRAAYARYVRKVFGAKAHELGFQGGSAGSRRRGTESPEAQDDRKLLRSALVPFVAGDGEDPELAAEAKKLALAWLDDHAAIDPEAVEEVLSISARTADVAYYERLRAEAKKAKDLKSRNRILGALAGVRDPELVKRNLELILSDEFDIKSVAMLMYGGLSEPETRQQVYDFVKAHFEAYAARLPRQSRARLIHVGGAFCDEAHRKDVEAFFQPKVADMMGGPRILANTLEEIDLCIALQKLQQPSVTTFLAKHAK